MNKLPDELLIQAYLKAKASQLSPLFINLLEAEIRRRSLQYQIQLSS